MLMITMTPQPDMSVLLETNEVVNGKRQQMIIANESDAMRVAYFWQRLYIQDKLKGWLKQRIYALKFSNDQNRIVKCAQLLHMLECYSSISLDALCIMIFRQSNMIHEVAPSSKSSHYKIYSNTILPILQLCAEMRDRHLKI